MDATWTQDLLTWASQNPGWTGVIVFTVAMVESLVLIGILIPGIVVLFGVGAMIGLGAIELLPVWLYATVGAFCGDAFSYMLGRKYREHLVEIWPFSRYPALLERGRQFFRRHGNKSVVTGRFIGPLRPIIPATGGMLGMKPGQFLLVDIPACVLWAPAYLVPGMLFGASLELAAEYAGRMTLVLLILLMALWLAFWLVWAIYDLLLKHSAQWLARVVRWSHRHPLVGKIARQILDPEQPEGFSVAMLGLLLIVVAWGSVLLVFFSPFTSQPVQIDQTVLAQAQALRNHIADPILVSIMQLSHWWVLLPAPAAVMFYLFGAGKLKAAFHWLIAIIGGVIIQVILGWTLRATPLLQGAGIEEFYTPSAALTLSTVVLGFFTVMLAREVRPGHEKWPYLVSALALTMLALSRLYLGLDWLSGTLIGLLLGFTWTAIVGIAYRLRAEGEFSGQAVTAIFAATLAATLAWQITRNLDEDLSLLKPEIPSSTQQESHWWGGGWAQLPRERTHFESVTARRFHAQIALNLSGVQKALQTDGWELPGQAGWQWLFKALNPNPGVDDLPLLGKDYIGHPEVLKMRKRTGEPGRQLTFRVWDSGVRLTPGSQPLYLAQVSEEYIEQRLAFFSYWKAVPAGEPVLRGVSETLSIYQAKTVEPDLFLFRDSQATGIEAGFSAGAPTARPDLPTPGGPGVPGS